MQLDRLNDLKSLLAAADKFEKPWDFFLTHFGEVPEFHDHGEQTEHPLLQKTLLALIEQIYAPSPLRAPMTITGQKSPVFAVIQNLFIIGVKSYGFYHGGFLVSGNMANFMFFEDINMGLLCITRHPILGDKAPPIPKTKPGDNLLYSRFTLAPMTPGKHVTVKMSKTRH